MATETIAERRAFRAANRLCRECAAGLQDTDGLRCLECAEQHRKVARRYMRSKKGRTAHAALQRRVYQSNPEAARTERMARYMDKKLSGRCHHCHSLALDGSSFCAEHRERVLKQHRKHNKNKRRASRVAQAMEVAK